MKILGRLSLGAAALATLLGASAGPAYAHEKWFVGEPVGGLRWELLFRPLPLALVGAVLMVTLLGGLLWRARGRGLLPGPEAFGATDGSRSLLYGLVPLILGIHVAVPLLVNGVQGTLFSPDNEMPGAWPRRRSACCGSPASSWWGWSRCWRTCCTWASRPSSC